jgi:hypothetical protein
MNQWHVCPKWRDRTFSWHTAVTAVPIFPTNFDILSNKQTNELRGARPRRFITVFTRARQPSVSIDNWILYPQINSRRSILIPSSNLSLGLPSGLFSSGFPNKTLDTYLSSPMPASWPATSVFLGLTQDHINGYDSLYVIHALRLLAVLRKLAWS